jgi:hypothetical protein
MAILYDSDNPDSIPSGVWAAGYVNGYAGPAWLSRGFARFPNARRITVFPTDEGDTCDVEWLDLTPEQAPPWVKGRLAAGVLQPWVYCNRSNRPAVEAALMAAAITAAQVALWVATFDGTQTVPAGPYPVAAVQYANSTLSGGHYDLSLVNQTFGPGGGTIGDDEMKMLILEPPGQGQWLLVLPSGIYFQLTTPAFVQSLIAQGAVDAGPIDATEHQDLLALRPVGGGSVPSPKELTGTFTGTLT